MNASNLTIHVIADTTLVDAAIERLSTRLAELRTEAKAIRECQPGTKAEIDAVLDGIEHLIKLERP